MAATISINFATPEEVFANNPPFKKSISAKTLNDVLGGGVVGGGYVQRNGRTPMTSYLTLFSGAPIDSYHATHKRYVDEHAHTRRFRFYIANDRDNKPGAVRVGGRDESGQLLRFFQIDDRTSFAILGQYVDVYRNGILLDPATDYILETQQVFPQGQGQPEFDGFVRFTRPDGFGNRVDAPLLSGSNIQVHVGNKGALPLTLGVASLTSYRGSGIRMENNFIPHVPTGDLRLSAYPLDFVATTNEMLRPSRQDVMVSPNNLSAFPLVPKAFGLFRREVDTTDPTGFYTRQGEASLDPPYGSTTGRYRFIRGYNITGLFSKLVDGEEASVHTCVLSAGVFPRGSNDYNPSVGIVLRNSNDLDRTGIGGEFAMPVVYAETRTFSGFKFDLYTLWGDTPNNVHEITITVI